MYIIDIKMPCWYIYILILFSLFYAIREVMERRVRLSNDAKKYCKENGNKYDKEYGNKYVIYYARDILSQVIFTISSFIALFIADYIFSKLNSFNDISPGTAILLIFLIIWGITGVSGYLGYIMVAGKFRSK